MESSHIALDSHTAEFLTWIKLKPTSEQRAQPFLSGRNLSYFIFISLFFISSNPFLGPFYRLKGGKEPSKSRAVCKLGHGRIQYFSDTTSFHVTTFHLQPVGVVDDEQALRKMSQQNTFFFYCTCWTSTRENICIDILLQPRPASFHCV